MGVELADIKTELDEVRRAIYNKQDKVPAVVWLPIFVWILASSISGIWWAATLTEQMTTLQSTIIKASTDRYKGKDAAVDFKLRDLKDDFLQQQNTRTQKDLEDLTRRYDKHTVECAKAIKNIE